MKIVNRLIVWGGTVLTVITCISGILFLKQDETELLGISLIIISLVVFLSMYVNREEILEGLFLKKKPRISIQ